MARSIFIAVLSGLLLSACGNSDQGATDHNTNGREETRNIRNTQSIGYSGDAIADQVDSALDANDQRNQRLQEAEDY